MSLDDDETLPVDPAARRPVPWATPGVPERIGRYQILERIAAGGMGEVFKGIQEQPVRRVVAIKIIRGELASESITARFAFESQILARMSHPNVAQIFDAGTTETGQPYFVMEFVEGEPITSHCDRLRLTLRERVALFQDVCRGLEHAHQKGVIHRDIKPSNVLVTTTTGRFIPKIIDFGIAKAVADERADAGMFATVGEALGTPAYMSPEQAAQTQGDIDTRTDIYSLGVLLYELLTGKLPFDVKQYAGLLALCQAIVNQDPPRPSECLLAHESEIEAIAAARMTDRGALLRTLRGDLDWIVTKALEKERERRYPSTSEFAADLERSTRDEPVLARPPSHTYRIRKFVRRHRAGVAAAAAVILTIVLMGSIALWQGAAAQRRARQVRANSILAAAAAVGDPMLKALLVEELENLPEPRGRLGVTREIVGSRMPAAVLRGQLGGVVGIAFSADGGRVAAIGEDDSTVRDHRINRGEILPQIVGLDRHASGAK